MEIFTVDMNNKAVKPQGEMLGVATLASSNGDSD